MDDLFEKDVRTYKIMIGNENYRTRLQEAYDYLKTVGVRTLEEFSNRDDLLVGAFTYEEMTIFDRIANPEYAKKLVSYFDTITDPIVDAYIKNEHIGDELASWGKLGETPYRDKLIEQGYVVEGLTEEEATRHFGR